MKKATKKAAKTAKKPVKMAKGGVVKKPKAKKKSRYGIHY